MYMKHCPECHNNSYSASNQGDWVCPTCGNDLTSQSTLPIDRDVELKVYDINNINK
jgi:tRNA(Ile2) C34 agmatinyltransferase TiaS